MSGLSPESMGVQFNLDYIVSELRSGGRPIQEIANFIREQWDKYSPNDQYYLFAFAVLDLASRQPGDLKVEEEDDGPQA